MQISGITLQADLHKTRELLSKNTDESLKLKKEAIGKGKFEETLDIV